MDNETLKTGRAGAFPDGCYGGKPDMGITDVSYVEGSWRFLI
jgi:hypothetical protein